MSRAFVHGVLSNDAQLLALGLTPDTIYGSQSLDSPLNGGAPFAVQRWGETPSIPGLGIGAVANNRFNLPSKVQELAIWVYDRPGDYDRIDDIIRRIRALFDGIAAVQTDKGWITQIDWSGDGNDLYDDTYEAIMRTTSYHVVASGR